MKFKATAALLIFSLVLLGALPSSFAGSFVKKASAQTNGPDLQVKDIGPKLRKQAEDEDFQRHLKQQLKKLAEKIKNEEGKADNGLSSDGNFTKEGPTKYFLGYDTVNGYYIKTYTRRGIGNNVEVWVANNLSWPEGDDRSTPQVNQEDVNNLIEEFDTNIYPKETDFFGDPDDHNGLNATFDNVLRGAGLEVPDDYYKSEEGKVMLLIDNFRDANYYDPTYPFYVAGFYSPTYELYFDRNIVNIDAHNIASSSGSSYGTLAHEFQHLIHDDHDSNEVTWLNEGMSDLAQYLVGYGQPKGHINYFLQHPENSLVKWDEYLNAETGPETLADYGQAYLLELYMLEHYGKDFIHDLALDEKNGIRSVTHVFQENGYDMDFGDLFQNFSVALSIDSPKPGHGKYQFKTIDIHVDYDAAAKTDKEGVPAWGADYIKLPESKIKNISFNGVDFLSTPWTVTEDPVENSDHGKVLYSGQGNKLDNKLIFKADLTGTDSPTLRFDTYYDIEQGWDFAVVQVSTDGGKTWTTLDNEDTTSEANPNALDYVTDYIPGFTGESEGWVQESFDLSKYSGQKILVSFRYLTDPASVYPGWYIDNVQIPEIGFSRDGSSLDGFYSLAELMKEYVNYQVTFINEKEVANGKRTQYKVLNYDPFNVTEDTVKKLKKISSRGENKMIVWYTAPFGQLNPVTYSYDILTQAEKKAMKHQNKHQNKHKNKHHKK